MFDGKKKIIIFIAVILLALILFFISKDKNEELEILEFVEIPQERIVELKSNHSEYSDSKIEFYSNTAKREREILVPCHGRRDEDDCVSAVAFLKERSDVCGHLEEGKIDEKIECAKPMLEKEIDECFSLEKDLFINCVLPLFSLYENKENCAKLESEEAREICESSFNYKKAYLEYDKSLCSEVKNEKLNQYCLDNIDY